MQTRSASFSILVCPSHVATCCAHPWPLALLPGHYHCILLAFYSKQAVMIKLLKQKYVNVIDMYSMIDICLFSPCRVGHNPVINSWSCSLNAPPTSLTVYYTIPMLRSQQYGFLAYFVPFKGIFFIVYCPIFSNISNQLHELLWLGEYILKW